MIQLDATGGSIVKYLFNISIILLVALFVSCDKDDPTSSRTVTCEAGCSTMSWGISGESGSVSYESTCIRTYNGLGDYSEVCTGSKTYEQSGNTYNYTATYDWINCSISVEVEGVGSCSDQVNSVNASKDCDCDESKEYSHIVKFKDMEE